jgi:hypothetical protein
MHWGNNPSA